MRTTVSLPGSVNNKQAGFDIKEHNGKMLRTVAEKMGSLRENAVFLGGTVIPLLLTLPSPLNFRRSKDVDIIVDFDVKQDLLEYEDQLWECGFEKLQNGVISNWKLDDIYIDMLPAGPVVQFSNKWFNYAHANAVPATIGNDIKIYIVSAHCFCAVKFNCFSRRGENDYSKSMDIYDVAVLLAGRPEIEREISELTSLELKKYLLTEIELLNNNRNAICSLLNKFSPGTKDIAAIESIICSRMTSILSGS